MDNFEQLKEVLTLLENDKFVEAHDLLENEWRKYKNDENTREESFILKAFLNASVSFEIYKMGRINHYENLWNTYKKYEYLIDKIDSVHSNTYKQIQDLIYKKKEKYIK